MTIKQVFVEDGVDRPHPPKKVIDAFRAGFLMSGEGYNAEYLGPGLDFDEEVNKGFYEWWESYA